MKLWKSAIYNHFNSPPTVFVEHGVVKYRFVCKINPYVLTQIFSVSTDYFDFILLELLTLSRVFATTVQHPI
jgi:hypothetical protein